MAAQIALRPLRIPFPWLKNYRNSAASVTHTEMDGAGHFFEEPHMDPMIDHVTTYVKRRLTENTR